MDRNVVGDSSDMSKATRLQKSRLPKELICEQTPPRRETRAAALERVNEHKQDETSSENSQLVLVRVENVLAGTECVCVCFCVNLCKCV